MLIEPHSENQIEEVNDPGHMLFPWGRGDTGITARQ